MEDSKVNLFYNPLVVKLIYQRLDFPNKKRFRLVCKTWIDTILGHWRKHSKLVLSNESNFNFNYIINNSNNPRVSTFKHCHAMLNEDYFNLYKINEKPLLNLKLRFVGFSYLPVHLDQLEQKNIEEEFLNFQSLILERFGPSLEYLETLYCPFLQDKRQEEGFRKLLLNDFPKLKVLSILPDVRVNPGMYTVPEMVFPKTHSDLQSFALNGGGYSQETARIILSLMPKLKELELMGGASDFLAVLKYPLYTSSDKLYLLLENLELEPGSDLELRQKIRPWLQEYVEAARPPVKTLKAVIIFGAPGPLQPFLYKPIWSCLENTLSRLWLQIFTGWTWFTLLTGSYLPNLTHLHILLWDRIPGGEQGLKFDFAMLKATPHLKKLYIMQQNRSECKEIVDEKDLVWSPNPEEVAVGTGMFLEHLDNFWFDLHQKLTESSWRVLAGFMPNLLKIRAIMDEQTCPLVLQLWPGLKHCVLRGNIINEELISEIDAQNPHVEVEEGYGVFLGSDEW